MSYRQPLCWCSFGVWTVVLVGNLPRWSECSMVTYCNFEGYTNICSIFLHNSVQIIVVPTDFIVWIFDLVFPKVLFRFEEFSASAVPIWELFPGTIDCKASFQTDELALLATWARHGNFSFNDLVAHPAWPKWAMQWMWGSKRWAKGSLQSFQCLEVVVRRVRMCGEIRWPSHGRYGTWTVECHSLHFLPFLNTFVTPKSIRLGKNSCHLAPNVQPCGSVTLTYVEIQHFQ